MVTRTEEFAEDGSLVDRRWYDGDGNEISEEQALALLGNVQTLRDRAQAALAANATFLGLTNPSNAEVLAQVRRLTRECNALIRLALGLISDVSDTV